MSIARKTDDTEVRHVVAAGLDVHKTQVTAAVRDCSQAAVSHGETRELAHWRAASRFSCSGCSACG